MSKTFYSPADILNAVYSGSSLNVATGFGSTADVLNAVFDSSSSCLRVNLGSASTSSDITRVANGTNTVTGGTAIIPSVNVVDSPSFNNITASGTCEAASFTSGGTNLNAVFAPLSHTHYVSFDISASVQSTFSALTSTTTTVTTTIESSAFDGEVYNGGVVSVEYLDEFSTPSYVNRTITTTGVTDDGSHIVVTFTEELPENYTGYFISNRFPSTYGIVHPYQANDIRLEKALSTTPTEGQSFFRVPVNSYIMDWNLINSDSNLLTISTFFSLEAMLDYRAVGTYYISH